MKDTEPVVEDIRVGPAEMPDDPLATVRRKAERAPLTSPPKLRRRAGKTAPPTPDQEGCYYLG